MKYNLYFKCTVLYLSLLTFFGCGVFIDKYLNLFEGPPRPKNEVAIIRVIGLVSIVEFDGLTIEEIKAMNEFTGSFVGYSILPGKHTVKILGRPSRGVMETTLNAAEIDRGVTMTEGGEYIKGTYIQAIFGEWTLKFSAEAGKKYILEYKKTPVPGIYKPGEIRLYTIYPYIMNEKTKKKVSSIVDKKKRYKSTWDKYKK